MVSYIKYFIVGLLIGIGFIAPGLSGSSLLVIFGLYSTIIEILASPIKGIKKNLLLLFFLSLGGLFGLFLGAKILNYFIINYQSYTYLFLLGLLLGSIFGFFCEVRESSKNNSYFLISLLGGVLVIPFFLFKLSSVLPENLNYIVLGLIDGIAILLPGLDSALTLSALGLYETLHSTLANPLSNILGIVLIGVSLLVSTLLTSTLLNKLFKKYYSFFIYLMFGGYLVLIPSLLFEVNKYYSTPLSIIFYILLCLCGFITTLLISLWARKKEASNDDNIKLETSNN